MSVATSLRPAALTDYWFCALFGDYLVKVKGALIQSFKIKKIVSDENEEG